MRPITALVLSVALAAPLVACRNETVTEDPNTQAPIESPESATEAPPAPPTQEELNAALWEVATTGAGNPEQVSALIGQGANPNMTRKFIGEQVPLLQQAAREGSAETIQALEAGGADWGALTQEQKGWALLDASCTGNSYTVSALTKAGADPNWANEFGETPAKMLGPDFAGTCNPQDPQAIRQVLEQAGADMSRLDLAPEPDDPAMALADVELG